MSGTKSSLAVRGLLAALRVCGRPGVRLAVAIQNRQGCLPSHLVQAPGVRLFRFAILAPGVALLLLAVGACRPAVVELRGAPPTSPAPIIGWEIVAAYPHDPSAFTQGLLWNSGRLLESTGLYGESTLRHVDLDSGRSLVKRSLPSDVFGEGLALHGEKLYQLTWRERKVFTWNAATLEPGKTLSWPGEGWGLANWNGNLLLSDGSPWLREVDPDGFHEVSRRLVVSHTGPVGRLNELEQVGKFLLANIFQTDRVAVIDPASGVVVAWLDFAGLLPESVRRPDTDVLNGLAWRSETKTLLVTGKRWPLLFEIRLKDAPPGLAE